MSAGAPTASGGRAAPELLWLAGAAAAGGVLWLVRGLLLPALVAALGAYFAQPLVARCEARGIRRGVAVVALFALATVALALLVVALAPVVEHQAGLLAAQLPTIVERVEAASSAAHRALAARAPWLAPHLPTPSPGWPERLLGEQKRHLGTLISGAGTLLFVLVLAPIFGFFLLRDGGRLLDGLVRALPARHIETTLAIWCEVDRLIGRYLRGLVIESIAVAGLVAGGLALVGVPAPIVLGAFAGLVNPLPYVGVLLSLAVALVTALGAGMGPSSLAAVVALFVAVRLVDDFVLIPLALGGSVHLHPALVIVAILVGEQTLGVLGMVLAVPLVTVVKEVTRLLLERARRGRGTPRRAATPLPTYVC